MTETNNIIPLVSLEELAIPKLRVIIQLGEDEDGNPIERMIPMRLLSWHRVREIRNSVRNPMPPEESIERDGKKLIVKHNVASPEYMAALDDCETKRVLLIILAAWDENELPLPGATQEDKLTWIRENLSANIVNQLINLLTDEAGRGKARIEERASTFQRG